MRKLQGSIDFQGLSISVENRKGSVRHWYDPHNKEEGQTKMRYPYGYIKGTLGTDGDQVDVYVGPDKGAPTVYVITQMKAPEFKEIDEQKCMLGFSSAAEAKKAYLEHYNNPKFFGSMKAFSVEEFKEKLKTHKGKLIKALNALTSSARLEDSTLMRTSMSKHEQALQLLRQTTETLAKAQDIKDLETLDKADPEDKDVEKGLRASVASAMGRQYRLHEFLAGAAAPQPVVGTTRRAEVWEPPVVPVRRIEPLEDGVSKGVSYVTCGCGVIHKSQSECPRCRDAYAIKETPTPKWEG